MARWYKLVLTTSFLIVLFQAVGQAEEIRVFSSTGMKEVLKELAPRYEEASGDKLNITFEVAAVLKTKIEAGEPFDVAILTSNVHDDLLKQGKIGLRTDLARTGIGLAIRAGKAKPDISSVDSFKRTLLGARSIAVPKAGFAGTYFLQVVQDLALTDLIRGKIIFTDGYSAELVANRKADLAVHLVSEILPVHGAVLVGPFPAELQKFVVLTAGISLTARQPDGAADFIVFLCGPDPISTFEAKGMEALWGAAIK